MRRSSLPHVLLGFATLTATSSLAACGDDDEACHDGHCHADGGVHAGTDGATADPVEAYCNCLLINCHDDFHARWGESDEEALSGCAGEARALPAGEAGATTGATLACRSTQCGNAASDAAACQAALGTAICL